MGQPTTASASERRRGPVVTLMATFVLILVSVLLVGASGIAMRNAVRRYRDVRRVIADRRRQLPQAATDPLAIFTREEVRALTTSPRRSIVRGTRFFGRQCPDPWAQDFQVEEHLWAVHANRLREMAAVGTVAVEVAIVLAGGILGVLLTQTPGSGVAGDGRGLAVAVTLLAVTGAVAGKVTLLREWQGAADRYRWLATSRVSDNLTQAAEVSPALA
jgi:hypothetical protein